MTSATGQQHELHYTSALLGDLQATIAQVGASLRQMSVGSIEIVQGFAADQPAPYCAGAVMSPWPNRIDGGKWVYQGQELQFDLNIVSQQNANHGLLLNHPYELISRTQSSITLGATIFARLAYPFVVETTVTYALGENGLTVTHTAINRSEADAPYAVGGHPYFKFSEVDPRQLVIKSQAKTRTTVNDRQIPIGEEPTLATQFDLRDGVRLPEVFIDQDFTDLERDANGNAHTYLLTPDGRGLDVWQDKTFKHVVIFTPGFFPTEDGGQTYAAAIEPSTAAPNAFNTGKNLAWLKNGELFTASWGVTPIV
jgi:aldose 1-epimerase